MTTITILELIGIAVACAASMFGIWSDSKLDPSTATISSIIAVCGFLVSIISSIWKERDAGRKAIEAERRRQDDVRSAFASAALNDLEIVWSFANVPPEIRKICDAADMISDTNFLRSSDRDRLPQELRSRAQAAWHLENAVAAMLVAVAEGSINLVGLFEGEDIDKAIQRYRDDRSEWVDDIGTYLSYVGPVFELVFPLNMKLNVGISLGNSADDIALKPEDLVWSEDDPELFAASNFGFEAEVDDLEERGLRIRWSYGSSSLRRAVKKTADDVITGGFPRIFSFVIVHQQLQEGQLLKKALPLCTPNTNQTTAKEGIEWSIKSEMEIVINGLAERKFIFDVQKSGTYQLTEHQGAYDAPEELFKYTKFDCILRGVR